MNGREDETRPVRGDEPPAIGSGDMGTFDAGDGRRQPPGHGWLEGHRGIPVCGGEARCVAFVDFDGIAGECLADPCNPDGTSPEEKVMHIPGRTPCPIAVQGLFEQLHQCHQWIEYLRKDNTK